MILHLKFIRAPIRGTIISDSFRFNDAIALDSAEASTETISLFLVNVMNFLPFVSSFIEVMLATDVSSSRVSSLIGLPEESRLACLLFATGIHDILPLKLLKEYDLNSPGWKGLGILTLPGIHKIDLS
jgi:hypothetical protein